MAYLILPSLWRQQPQQAVLVSAEARAAGLVSAPLWSQGVGRVHDPAFPAQQFVNVGGTLKPGQNGVGLSLVAASLQYLKSAVIPLNPKNGFTALALIKPASSAPAASSTFLGFGNAADAQSIVYGFQLATSGNLGIQFRDSSGLGALITTSQQMLAGTWYAVACSSNGTNSTSVRINGTTYTDTTAIGAFTTPDNYTIGGLYRTAIALPFDGEMHGPWLFNTVLTDSQIDGWLANIWRVYQAPRRRIYVSVGGGTQFTLTLSAPVTASSVLSRSIAATRSASTTAVASATRTDAKTFAASSAVSATVQPIKAILRSLSASSTLSATLTRQAQVVRQASSAVSATVSRAVAVTRSATTTASAALVRQGQRSLAASTSIAALLVRQAGKSLALSTTLSVALATLKQAGGLTLTAATTVTATLARSTAKIAIAGLGQLVTLVLPSGTATVSGWLQRARRHLTR